jgi:hypothetical protein
MIRKNIFYNLTLKKNIKSQLTNHEHRFFSTEKKRLMSVKWVSVTHNQSTDGINLLLFFAKTPTEKFE